MAKQRILIVDDEPILSNLTAKRLRSENFDVVCYFEGTGVIDFISETKPDAILLDVMLPGISGYDIFDAIKANKKLCNIPIIFFTAKSIEENRRFLLAEAYVQKPYKPNDLVDKIKMALSLRKEY